MYLCYMDESGISDSPGNTSHFVLAGLSIPIWHWKDCDREIEAIKKKYALEGSEIHVAWMMRPYIEQRRIKGFEGMDYEQRRSQVETYRKAELLRLQKSRRPRLYKQTRKNYRETESFIHLTYAERRSFTLEIGKCVSEWGFARLFAECIDKIHFDPVRTKKSVDEQCFEQIVSRFEQYLQIIGKPDTEQNFGLLIHDNNQTIARRYTDLMKKFHQRGTLWTKVKNIIETPLFVDSQLTSMVQIVDVCAYALRRYLENEEEELFELVFQRADRKDSAVVGVRHFTNPNCSCKICSSHRKSS